MALGDRVQYAIKGFDAVGASASAAFVIETDLNVPVSGWCVCDGGWVWMVDHAIVRVKCDEHLCVCLYNRCTVDVCSVRVV